MVWAVYGDDIVRSRFQSDAGCLRTQPERDDDVGPQFIKERFHLTLPKVEAYGERMREDACVVRLPLFAQKRFDSP
jgi:hypothetical protein